VKFFVAGEDSSAGAGFEGLSMDGITVIVIEN
jgi:hypothetical protein